MFDVGFVIGVVTCICWLCWFLCYFVVFGWVFWVCGLCFRFAYFWVGVIVVVVLGFVFDCLRFGCLLGPCVWIRGLVILRFVRLVVFGLIVLCGFG